MLVSIIVITYNSSPYVLETLESTYRQTYPDLELIVSDDCSTDNTFALCQKWVSAHASRFRRAICTQTPRNLGICGNYNHALTHATGEWVKFIAGDDILLGNCIQAMANHITKGIPLYFSGTEHISASGEHINHSLTPLPNLCNPMRQLRQLLRYRYCLEGCTLFVSRAHAIAMGGFDMTYPMVEDYPFIVKTLSSGKRIFTIPQPLVKWRNHANGVSSANRFGFMDSCSLAYTDSMKRYAIKLCLPLHLYHCLLNDWIVLHHHHKHARLLGYLLRCIDLVQLKRKIFPVAQLRVQA